jgi:hypothetical protein
MTVVVNELNLKFNPFHIDDCRTRKLCVAKVPSNVRKLIQTELVVLLLVFFIGF